MACISGRLKCVLINFLIFYTVYLSYFKCPLSQPLSGDAPFICAQIHSIHDSLSPVYVKYVEPHYQTFIHPHLKPIVDRSKMAYNSHLSDKVVIVNYNYHKYINPTLTRANKAIISPIFASAKRLSVSYYPVLSSKFDRLLKYAQLQSYKISRAASIKSKSYGLIIHTYFLESLLPVVKFHFDSASLECQNQANTIFTRVRSQYDDKVHQKLLDLSKTLKIDIFLKHLLKVLKFLKVDSLIAKVFEIFDYLKFQHENYKFTIKSKEFFLKNEIMKLNKNVDDFISFNLKNVNKQRESKVEAKSSAVPKGDVPQKKSKKSKASTKAKDEIVSALVSGPDGETITETYFSSETVETIVKTITSTVQLSESSLQLISDEDVDEMISGSQRLSDEILDWQNMIMDTCDSSIYQLSEEIIEMERNLINDELKPVISQWLTDIQKETMDQYRTLNSMILNITSHPSQSEEYHVSRKEVRDIIKLVQDDILAVQKKCQSKLEKALEGLEVESLYLKQQTIDTLEEFAEVTIQEFSKKMVDTKTNFNADWNDWKEFHKIRKFIYATRDKIYYLNLEDIQGELIFAYIKDIQFTTNFLIKDSASYLQILRAKANLAFQMREEAEQLENEAKGFSKDEEEDETITHTLFSTVVLNESGIPITTQAPILDVLDAEETAVVELSEETENKEDQSIQNKNSEPNQKI